MMKSISKMLCDYHYLNVMKWLGSRGPKLQGDRRKLLRISSALPETVVSVSIATVVVGAAATVLIKRTQQPERYILTPFFFS